MVMVEFGTSSAFRGWVRVRVLGYGFGVRGRKVKSRDCALASELVKDTNFPLIGDPIYMRYHCSVLPQCFLVSMFRATAPHASRQQGQTTLGKCSSSNQL